MGYVHSVGRTNYTEMKKIVWSVGQNQPNKYQNFETKTENIITKCRERGQKNDIKKIRKMAYAHVAEREKQTQGIVLALCVELKGEE